MRKEQFQYPNTSIRGGYPACVKILLIFADATRAPLALETRGDVTEASLRQKAIDLGWVDYKICSVDNVWSAMLFAAKR